MLFLADLLFVYNYAMLIIQCCVDCVELGNMISSLVKGFIIVLVVELHCTNHQPNLTLAVAGLLSLRVSPALLTALQIQMEGGLRLLAPLAVDI